MPIWQNDNELFGKARQELFTSVVGDVMDKLKLFHQFLPPQIRALNCDYLLIGRAMPVISGDVFGERVTGSANKMMEKPFGLMLEALDDMKPHEIYVNTGASPKSAMWGELMTTRARILGAAGAVVNGYTRDTKAVLRMEFPIFAFGSYGQDSAPRYKVYDYRVPIEIGQVRIEPGDVIFGDIDGVCVIPTRAEVEVFSMAFEKARGEKLVKRDLERGDSAVATFARHGIM